MKRKIKAFFKKHPSLKIKPKKLAEQLFIKQTYEYAKLKEVLHVLVAESFLTKVGKRYQLYIPTPKNIVGRIMISRDGSYGFVSSNNHSFNDIFIPGKYLNTAFSGDIVQVDLLAKKKGKNIEGAITKVIERRRKELIGTLHKTKSFYFVLPDEKDIHRDIYIAASNLNNAKNNDKVVVGNIEWNSHLLNPEGKITEILGKAGTYETEIAAIAREFNISYKFPAKVLKEAKGISEKISPSEYKKRLDLRSENVFTIDPEDAKDFDDAVSVKVLNNGNFLVGIHIADVSYYLKEDSLIFKEASKRGTSVYLVNNVIPMLPEKLSNDVCSLVPQKDRLTYSVLVELTGRMKIVKYQIKKSIIRSKKRFTYSEAQKILDNKRGEFYNELSTLNKIAVSLRKKRMRKGSINFIRPEIEFKLDDKGVPLNIQIKKLEPTNNLIEELMLLANQIVASHPSLNNSRIDFPFIYRIHDLPDKEKLFEFAKFVKTLGYNFNHDDWKIALEYTRFHPTNNKAVARPAWATSTIYLWNHSSTGNADELKIKLKISYDMADLELSRAEYRDRKSVV